MPNPRHFGMAVVRTVMLLPLSASFLSAQTPSDNSAFLTQNSEALDVSDGGAHLQAHLIDPNRLIFFLGESHGIAINEDLDLAMLQYLHKAAGVRIYLAEISYAEGCLLNRYLDKGDEPLLDFVMNQFEGSIAWTKEHKAFYQNFRRWNLTLAPDQRVHFAGVDIEHQRYVALRFLKELAKQPDHAAPAAIMEVVGKLQGLGDTDGGKLPDVATDLGAALKAHHAEFVEFLGRGVFDFELVTENLLKALEYYKDHNSRKSNELRERVMYDTFLKLYPQFGGAKCYGRWGSAHIFQRALDRGETFAMMLNRPGSPVAGKVASILMVYKDTQALQMPGYRVQNADSPVDWLTPFAAATTAPLTLFRLAGIDSLGPNPLMKGDGKATDFAQYVVLVKDAKPEHPLGDLPAPTKFGELPAVVVKSVPESGSTNVSPGLTEIRVTFSKPMGNGWAWCRSAIDSPSLSDIHYDTERRTIVATTKLEPDHQYAVWLNMQGCTGFKDADGRNSVPYLLSFHTAK